MNLNYSIQNYDKDIEQAYRDLLPHQTDAIDGGVLDWKFVDNPAGKGLVAVCRTDENEIVGINGFQPGKFQANNGQQYLAYQSMDTIVSPSARGQGVFGKLLETFYSSKNGDLIYGFPNSQSSKGFFGRLGWTSLGSTPYLVRPVRSGYFGKKLLKSFPDFKLPSFSVKPVEFEEITKFDARATLAAVTTTSNSSLCLLRDEQYLNWRIFDNPTRKYTVFTADHEAYVIGDIAEKHGGKIGYILDAFGKEELLPGLIAAMVEWQSKNGADAILGWCLPHSSNLKAHKKAGFFNLNEKLRPIEINFGARNLSEKIDGMLDNKNWYISYLDSDTV